MFEIDVWHEVWSLMIEIKVQVKSLKIIIEIEVWVKQSQLKARRASEAKMSKINSHGVKLKQIYLNYIKLNL